MLASRSIASLLAVHIAGTPICFALWTFLGSAINAFVIGSSDFPV